MILDAVTHVWCPLCQPKPGRVCNSAAGPLHVDHDGATADHAQRLEWADRLVDDPRGWRADELRAFVRPLMENGAVAREGRA